MSIMAHIFISYAKKDTRDLAFRIRDALRSTPGVTCWMDESLRPGKSWAAQIQAEIRRCDAIVVLLSPDVNRDPGGDKGLSFVINEIEYAQRLRKDIIPLMAQQTDPPVQIAAIQYIDLTHGEAAGIQALLAEVADLVAHVPAALPMTAPLPQTAASETVVTRSLPRVALAAGAVVVAAVAVVLAVLSSQTPAGNATMTLTTAAPVVNNPTPTNALSSPAPTLDAIAAARATNTAFAEQTVAAYTDTPTATATATPNETATMSAALTIVFEENLLTLAQSGVTRNAAWTPVERDFDGVMMVLVPAACFSMGSTDGDSDEQPVEQQCIDTPFWIDKEEVTNVQYGSTGCTYYSSESDQPRSCVNWFDASAFCETRGARLPTEVEWEYAARGPDGLKYPWGDTYDAALVIGADDPTHGDKTTAPVGSRAGGASWVGALDMSGNVWEWVSSLYRDYPYRADDGREDDANRADARVIRGGSFLDSSSGLRAALRGLRDPWGEISYIGFRCARSSK